MKPSHRIILLLACLILAGCGSSGLRSVKTEAIYGCWDVTESRLLWSNGRTTTTNSSSTCTQVHREQVVQTTCDGPTGRMTVVYSRTQLSNRSYFLTALHSANTPKLALFAKPHEYELQGTQLVVTGFPEIANEKTGARVVKQVTTLARRNSDRKVKSECAPNEG